MQPLDSSAAESGTQQARGSRRGAVAIIIALLAVLALFSLPPHDLLDKADRFAYAVCHRIPSHSFFIGGRQLPLCARCSGTYLGALAGIVVLLALGRGRANRFPAPKFLVVFGIFMAAWAIDGVNSYAVVLPGPAAALRAEQPAAAGDGRAGGAGDRRIRPAAVQHDRLGR